MTRNEAIDLLKATQSLLTDPDGQPISDLFYAIDIAINSIDFVNFVSKKLDTDWK